MALFSISPHAILFLNKVIMFFNNAKGMEMMGPSKRTFAGIVIEYFFAIGQFILVAFAYINNVYFMSGWRTLAIALIVPIIPFLSYFL